MHNGEVWRTWRFVIGSNGRPPIHPEQTGNINLNYNSYLVDMEIPAGGSAVDGRLNGASSLFFFGQPWDIRRGKSNGRQSSEKRKSVSGPVKFAERRQAVVGEIGPKSWSSGLDERNRFDLVPRDETDECR